MVKSAQSTLIDLVCWCLAHLSSHVISQVWRLKLMKSHFLYIPSTRPGGVVVGVGLRHWWMSHVHWWRRRSQGAPASHHCGGGSRGHRRGTDAAWWGVHGVLVEPQRLSVVMGSNKTSPLSCSRHQSGINISKWNVFGRFWNIINPPKKNMNHSLVGGFNHLENYYSMGRIIPYIMENTSHVWNHQPALEYLRGNCSTSQDSQGPKVCGISIPKMFISICKWGHNVLLHN